MEVITLNEEHFNKKCIELIEKIDFNPDMVIGILQGGGIMLDSIKASKKTEANVFGFVKLKKANTSKKNKKLFVPLLKMLPYSILNKLRHIESNKIKKSIQSLDLNNLAKQDIDLSLPQLEEVKSILIIDDAIDSGKTMFVVNENIKRRFPKAKIRIAVISWTLNESIIKPDFYLYKNILVRFPWSLDFKN